MQYYMKIFIIKELIHLYPLLELIKCEIKSIICI